MYHVVKVEDYFFMLSSGGEMMGVVKTDGMSLTENPIKILSMFDIVNDKAWFHFKLGFKSIKIIHVDEDRIIVVRS